MSSETIARMLGSPPPGSPPPAADADELGEPASRLRATASPLRIARRALLTSEASMRSGLSPRRSEPMMQADPSRHSSSRSLCCRLSCFCWPSASHSRRMSCSDEMNQSRGKTGSEEAEEAAAAMEEEEEEADGVGGGATAAANARASSVGKGDGV